MTRRGGGGNRDGGRRDKGRRDGGPGADGARAGFDAARLIATLRRHADVFASVYAGLPADEARWRPAAGNWSPIEILGHLLDEEREDFRVRLESTLDEPARPWPPIDPEARVVEHGHQERDPGDLLAEFLDERAESLRRLDARLASSSPPGWERAHDHPRLGRLRAGDLLAAWVAHDLGHLRQIARARLAWVAATCAPYDPGYSGA